MDQSKNINPNTGQRSNITLDVNANFDSDVPDIIINDITDDTITFTTGTSISSGVYLSYAFTDECNGLSAQATVSSWCSISNPPLITDKVISFYENSTYTLNVITGDLVIVNTPSNAGDGTVTSTDGWDRSITNYNGTLLSSDVKIVDASSPNATVTFTDHVLTITTGSVPATPGILPVNITYTIQDECKQTTATLSGANNTAAIGTTNVFNGQSTGHMTVPTKWRRYAFSGDGARSSAMSATSGWYTVCFDSYTAEDSFYVQLRSQAPALDSCGNTWFPSIVWGTGNVGGIEREFGPYGDAAPPPRDQGGARYLYFKPENYEMYLWGKTAIGGSAYELGITQVFAVTGSRATLDLGIDPSTGFPELTAPPTDAQLVAFLDAYSRFDAFAGESPAEHDARAPGRFVFGTTLSARSTWMGEDGQVDRTPEAQAFIPGVTDARFTGTRSVLDGAVWNTWPLELNARPICAP